MDKSQADDWKSSIFAYCKVPHPFCKFQYSDVSTPEEQVPVLEILW